jgi:hypothetical protein
MARALERVIPNRSRRQRQRPPTTTGDRVVPGGVSREASIARCVATCARLGLYYPIWFFFGIFYLQHLINRDVVTARNAVV